MNIHPPTEVHVWGLIHEQNEEEKSCCSSPEATFVSTSPLSSPPNSPLHSSSAGSDNDEADDKDNAEIEGDRGRAPFDSNGNVFLHSLRKNWKRVEEVNIIGRESRKSRIRASRSSWTSSNTYINDKSNSSHYDEIPILSKQAVSDEPPENSLVFVDNCDNADNVNNVISPLVLRNHPQKRTLQSSPISPIHMPRRLPGPSMTISVTKRSTSYVDNAISEVFSVSDDRSTESIHHKDHWDECGSSRISSSTAPSTAQIATESQNFRSDHEKGIRNRLFDVDPTFSDQQFSYDKLTTCSQDEESEVCDARLLLPHTTSRSETHDNLEANTDEDPTFTDHVLAIVNISASSWQTPQQNPQKLTSATSEGVPFRTSKEFSPSTLTSEAYSKESVDPSNRSLFRECDSNSNTCSDRISTTQQLDPSLDEEIKNVSIISRGNDEDLIETNQQNPTISKPSDPVIFNVQQEVDLLTINYEDINHHHEDDQEEQKDSSFTTFYSYGKNCGTAYEENLGEFHSKPDIDDHLHCDDLKSERIRIDSNRFATFEMDEGYLETKNQNSSCTNTTLKSLSNTSQNPGSEFTRNFHGLRQSPLNWDNNTSTEEHLNMFFKDDSVFNLNSSRSETVNNLSFDEPSISSIRKDNHFQVINASFNQSTPTKSEDTVQVTSSSDIGCLIQKLSSESNLDTFQSPAFTRQHGNSMTQECKESLERDKNSLSEHAQQISVQNVNEAQLTTSTNERFDYYNGSIFDKSISNDLFSEEGATMLDVDLVHPLIGHSSSRVSLNNHDESYSSTHARKYFSQSLRSHHVQSSRGRKNGTEVRKKRNHAPNSIGKDDLGKGHAILQSKLWQKAFHRHKSGLQHKLLQQSPESIRKEISKSFSDMQTSTSRERANIALQESTSKTMMDSVFGWGNALLGSEIVRGKHCRMGSPLFVQANTNHCIGNNLSFSNFSSEASNLHVHETWATNSPCKSRVIPPISSLGFKSVLEDDFDGGKFETSGNIESISTTKSFPPLSRSLDSEIERSIFNRLQGQSSYDSNFMEPTSSRKISFTGSNDTAISQSSERPTRVQGKLSEQELQRPGTLNHHESKNRCILFPNIQSLTERVKPVEALSKSADFGHELQNLRSPLHMHPLSIQNSYSEHKRSEHNHTLPLMTTSKESLDYKSTRNNINKPISYAQINLSGETVTEVLELIPNCEFISKRNDCDNNIRKSPLLVRDLSSSPPLLPKMESEDNVTMTSEMLLSELDYMMKDLDETLGNNKHSTQQRKAKVNDIHATITSQKLHFSPVINIDATNPTNRGVTDLSTNKKKVPLLVITIDNDIGIPKGDIMISLLRDSSYINEQEANASPWSERVNDAIWRCRTMRRNCDTKWLSGKIAFTKGKRSSVIVDVDEIRVLGGVDSIESTQAAVLDRLKFDDFDDALILYESILETYNLCAVDAGSTEGMVHQYKAYIGTALHNIGIIHLLNRNPQTAFTYFERASLMRESCLGPGHPDQVASLVMMSICFFALEDFSAAHSSLELALGFCRDSCSSVADYRQLAEILNNLGCLSYMCGEIESAFEYFGESIELHSEVSKSSLYIGSKFSCQSLSLNLSVCRANTGLVALAVNNVFDSIAELELAVKDQLYLLRDADSTLISTMEHLAVANLTAGRRMKALQLLRRMLHMQIDSFGPNDERCKATGKKIYYIEQQIEDSEKG